MHTLRLLLLFLLALSGSAIAQRNLAAEEFIVVSGGPALRAWEDYRVPEEQHDRYAGNFIKAAHIRLEQIRAEQGPTAKLTWLVYRPAYVSRDREDQARNPPYTCYTSEIVARAAKCGANIVWFSNKDFVINYLNYRNGRKIADLEFFVHSNKYAFLFDYSNDLLGVSTCYLHSRELKRIHKGLFTRDARVQSWGCHTAEFMSAAWKKATGVPLIGAIGKTDYRAIGDNVSLPSIGGRWSR
ncbi:MAG TPA: hypothetical protein VG796_24155 [Verrucomicrobiales bacterium]|jgi:hypothetical protein|nr:hypothetical protein [Verrucomicrobiales bacterium]